MTPKVTNAFVNLDPNSKELLTFDPRLNMVEIRLVQQIPFPNVKYVFSITTALFNNGKHVGQGVVTWEIRGTSSSKTRMHLYKGTVVDGATTGNGWCEDTSDIKNSGLVTFVRWKFDKEPYAIAGGANWTKSGKFNYCTYTLTWGHRSWQPVVDAADAIRVTIADKTRNFDDKIVQIKYKVYNCESLCQVSSNFWSTTTTAS